MSTKTQAAAPANEEFDIRRYLHLVLSYKWVILSIAILISLLVALWTMKQPKVYQAVCTLEYDPNPPRPLGRSIEDVADPVSNYWATREYFETQNRILHSRALAERVVTRLSLHRSPDFFFIPEDERGNFESTTTEFAAQSLRQRVKIEPVQDTRLVKILVKDRDPERAQLVANTLADVYIEKTMEDRLGSTVAALEWLGQQLDNLRQELDESELALHTFKREHDVLSVSMEDRQNLVASDIQAFNGALTQTRTRRIELQARARRIRAANRTDPMQVNPSIFPAESAVHDLRTLIRTKEQEFAALRLRYDVNHPTIIQLTQDINVMRENLRQEVSAIVDEAEADLREAVGIEGGIRAAVRQAHEAGLELNLREIEYQRLNRERENKSKLYELVLQRTTETDLTRMLRTTHVRVVDRALKPGAPISPKMVTNVAGGIGAGIILGFAFAFLLSRLDRRLKSIEDVENLGVTVLGVMPTLAGGAVADAGYTRKKKRRFNRGEAAAGLDDQQSRDLIVHTHPMSAAAECTRTVRTNLTFMAASEPLRAIVVTSSHPREGKTTVAVSIAISMAQSGKSVLLIDTDLRRPRLHRVFGARNGEKGTSSVLVGAHSISEATRPTEIPRLTLMPCGPIPPNPSELLYGPGFARLVEEATELFDFVLFDSPPVAAVTDAAILTPQLDGVVFVINGGSTSRDAALAGLRQLRDVGSNILGAVVNKIDLGSDKYSGYYYYYRRYGYYYGAESEADNPADHPANDSDVDAAE